MNTSNQALILIVDDNPQNIQVLGNILEREKYDIAIAINGNDALDFIEKDKPDLILLDIMMPEIDGYEVCKKIKKDLEFKDIPVIFLSAKREIDDLLKGFEAGGVDFIAKPFHHKELLVRVKTHLELKHSREEIKTLRGIIPICSNCKKIRNDEGYYQRVEDYIRDNSEAVFSHGVCPECIKILYPDLNI